MSNKYLDEGWYVGEWEGEVKGIKEHTGKHVCIGCKGGEMACLCGPMDDARSVELAHFLVAAPALYEACKAAESLITHAPDCNERYYGRDQTCNCGFRDAKKVLRAALASATPETPSPSPKE